MQYPVVPCPSCNQPEKFISVKGEKQRSCNWPLCYCDVVLWPEMSLGSKVCAD